MKYKLILIIAAMFLFISFTSASIVNYDDFQNDVLNESLWKNVTFYSGDAIARTNETGGYLEAVSISGTAQSASANITSIALPLQSSYIRLDFEALAQIETGAGTTFLVNITVFGNALSERVGTGSISFIDRNNWSVRNVGSTWDVYRNGAFNKSITALNNNITLQTISIGGTSEVSRARIYYVNYTVLDSIYNYTTYETSRESYITNTSTLNASVNVSSAKFVFNGTEYTGSVTNLGDTNFSLSYTYDIPTNIGLKNWYWEVTYSNSTINNLTLNQQQVDPSILAICNSTINTPYINFTFKDEVSLATINASADYSLFNYWLGSGLSSKSLSYTNTTNNPFYQFCFTPNSRTIHNNITIKYASTSYPQRTFQFDSDLNGTTTNQILYLLGLADGQYVTFQVLSGSLQPLANVLVNVSRTGIPPETKITDASGAVTFFMNPLQTYTIVASISGYPTYTTSITPTSTSYTINLGGTTTPTANDYTRGITYSMLPEGFQLNNNTIYSFNFTISSNYWSLDRYGFTITNGTGYVLGSISDTTSTGGVVNLNLNTMQNKTLFLNAFWSIDNNYTNVSKAFIIVDSSGNQFSIWHFFTRLSSYLNEPTDSDGLFGLKNESGVNFGLIIIIYVVIFIVTGIMSYKFGLISPPTILAIVFALVLLFEVTLGIIDVLPNSNVPILTVVTGLITVGVIFREVST